MIIILSLGGVYTSSATTMEESYKLNFKDNDTVLKMGNYELRNPYVYYEIINENGEIEEYPAYCLNKNLPGIEHNLDRDYIVRPDGLVTDDILWTAIINGYPYKTIEELGCNTKEEAYAATLQAIYCILYHQDENNFSNYSALNESGERVLAALRTIVDNARNYTQTKASTWVDIFCDDNVWEIDNIDEKYVYKEFIIQDVEIKDKFTIQLGEGYPEGTLITDLNNKVTNEFENGEHFKVIIPADKITGGVSFYIKVSTKVKTLPVYDASTGNPNLQNYALTHELYEDGEGQRLEEYEKCNSKITITKMDDETKARLKGAVFNILNETKEVVYAGLVTDEDGQVEVENVAPGTYFLEETIAPKGYHKLEWPVRLDVKNNQDLSVSVNNTVEKRTESSTITGNITITDKYEEYITNTEHYEDNIEFNKKNNINNQKVQSSNENNLTLNEISNITNENNSTLNQSDNVKEENNTRVSNTENIKQEIDNSIENKQKNITAISASVKSIKELPKTGM